MSQRRPDSAYMIRNTDISNAGYDIRMLACQQYYMLSFDMPTFMQIGFHLILSIPYRSIKDLTYSHPKWMQLRIENRKDR